MPIPESNADMAKFTDTVDALLDSLEETGVDRVRQEIDPLVLAVRERMLARGMPVDSVLAISIAGMSVLFKFA